MLIENDLIRTIEKNQGAFHFALVKNLHAINKLFGIDNDGILHKIKNILQLLSQSSHLAADNLNELSLLDSLTKSFLLQYSARPDLINDGLIKDLARRLSRLIINVFVSEANNGNTSSSEIKILQGKEIDTNVIYKSLRVYKLYFGEVGLGTSDVYFELHEHNPDMYFYALDTFTKDVVGNLEAIPFDKAYLDEYENGIHDIEFADGSYPIEKIPQYHIPGVYSLVLELIAIDPEYKGYRAVLRKLLTALIEKLLNLAKDDIFIQDIFTDVYTDEGEKLAKHFGFKKIRKSIDGHLYKISLLPPEILSLFPENVKSLQNVYKNRFEQYQKLIENHNVKINPNQRSDDPKLSNLKYSVGLSFSGNDRDYVERVATELKRLEINVFYDEFEQVDLWGKDLYQYLNQVYKNDCKFCIVFISKSYAEKLWTRLEIKSAQARAFETGSEYILPVRMDDTELPGINSTTGYLDGRKLTPEELAIKTFEKINS